jgi:hypothetical protein
MALPHRGQAEGGVTMERDSGSRQMQTFKKLPMHVPMKKIIIRISQSGAMESGGKNNPDIIDPLGDGFRDIDPLKRSMARAIGIFQPVR